MKALRRHALVGLICALAAGCGSAPPAAPDPAALLAALKEGADFALPCGQQIDEEAADNEFPDCIQARAGLVRRSDALDPARRLGVWYVGWLLGEINGGNGIAAAQRAADRFLPQLLNAQRRLGVTDLQLCALVQTTCERVMARKAEAARALGALPVDE